MTIESSAPARKSFWGFIKDLLATMGMGVLMILGASVLAVLVAIGATYSARLDSSMQDFEAARHMIKSTTAPDNPVVCIEFTDSTVSDEELKQGSILTLPTKERARVIESFGRNAQGCTDGRFALRVEKLPTQ